MSGFDNRCIRDIFALEKLDAIIIFGLPNIRYLSGFTGTDGVFFLAANRSVFFTDSRYISQAEKQVKADQIKCYRNKLKTVADQLLSSGCKRVGIDAEVVSVALFEELKRYVGDSVQWCLLGSQLQPLRGVKTDAEIVSLKKAAYLNSQAFASVLPLFRPGVTELEISQELEFSLKRLGGEANAFDFIVASGIRGALPHGVASDKRLQAGELVTIDFGTRVNGYHSDETVTLAIGEVDRNLRQIFDIVLEAHDSALEAIRPGMLISELDAVARNYIASQGYGDYFGHALGHGVGLEIHEFPAVSSRSDQRLLAGMVITIEPGIYISGTGGVRIEDTVVVTDCGFEKLTLIPKQFKQINV
ncbi:Xaa-Pro aminopeptidase [Desulfuromusa kysingii]|uniref:Xaa-Pro aminopeptidase n=1 Tax=Desulfuromusa kysingii TaxID=37625 RepID=A0A1H4CXY9_9BACT|nr:aminopeptidase P family protein [Desulfuromusa kysingii]SEA65353.1 Xaa-Pro aminopeptidase [Desulfuromusa kysingii]